MRSAHDGQDLEGHRVRLVGVGAGIGRAAAFHLAQRVAQLQCVDRDGNAVRAVVDPPRTRGADAVDAALDVTDDVGVAELVSRTVQDRGGLEGLLNCAAITGTMNALSREIAREELDQVYRVNLRAAFSLSRAVLPTWLTEDTDEGSTWRPSPARRGTLVWSHTQRPRPD